MNPIEKVADMTYVINLAHRTDRMDSFRAQMSAIGLKTWKRFDAYGVNNPAPSLPPGETMTGWWGNKLSHMGVIEKARKNRLAAVMVFEDDVILHPRFNDVAEAAITQLAGVSWDWLQFGGNHRFFGGKWLVYNRGHYMKTGQLMENPRIGNISNAVSPSGLVKLPGNIARIVRMITAHAYIVREPVYDFILNNAIDYPFSIDHFYGYEVNPNFQCYCVVPCVATQMPGIEDITGTYADHTPYIGD